MDKQNSHYEMHGLFWKEPLRNATYFKDRKDKLCHITKTFADANLYTARQEAIAYYQSLVDVLYEALDGCYTTDYQARIDLQAFLHAGCISSVTCIGKMTFDDNLFIEIAVYWVNGTKKRLIHGIGYRPEKEPDTLDETIATMGRNLIKEHQYYERHDIPFSDEILCDMTDIGCGFEFVLPTPFDWDGFADENLLKETQALRLYNTTH